MDKSNNREIVPMEDDEDLEVLRLMALKTLHKKENASAQQTKNVPPAPHKPMKIMPNHTIPVLNNVRHPMDNKFYPTMGLIQSNIIHHPVPSFVNSGFEKMDINEPYVPQRIHPISVDPFNGFPNYIPSSTTTTTTTTATAIVEPNVQLSPRTAAFVLANKEIIERRRIISPEPYRKSPGRWSRSPSPENWKYRRSVSRSPSYHNSHSPNMRNRSVTPPSRRRHSPTAVHNRKSRSRSPIPRNQHENNYHRAEKRSPNRIRSNAPPYNNRNDRKCRGGHESHRSDTVRKSNSPRTDDTNHRNKRRTQSPPFNSKLDIKKPSPSRSPNRKYIRNSNPNLRRGRRSPPPPPPPGKRFNSNNNGRQNNTNARNRNYNTRRSTSPTMNRRNDSRTPPNQQKPAASTKNEDEPTKKSAENESKAERNENKEMSEDKMSNKKSGTETTAMVPREKSEQEIEDELLKSDGDSDSDDDDGIDLFASEDSESENEGRFKLSSSKSERKTNVATVSFSELGKAAAPSVDVLRDLDEVQTDAGPSQRKVNPRRENGRETRASNSRHHGQRYNEKRSYSDRDCDRDHNRNDRGTRERENRDSNKSIGSNGRRKDMDTDQTSVRGERKSTMLKSTFNSIESESRRKTPESANSSVEVTEKEADELKRGAIALKRSNKNTETDAGIRSLQSTITGPTMNEKQRSSPTADANNGGSTGKKPIHSRLGAMTSTWKPNKKSWKSEKVFFIQV